MSNKLAVFNKTKATCTNKQRHRKTKRGQYIKEYYMRSVYIYRMKEEKTIKTNEVSSVVLGLIKEPCKSTKGPEHRFPKLPDKCFSRYVQGRYFNNSVNIFIHHFHVQKRRVNMPTSQLFISQLYNFSLGSTL